MKQFMTCACLFALAAMARTAAATPTFISNIDPRRDVNGALMDAHDGSTIQFEAGGDYYWHAMGYGRCIENGKQADGHCGQLSNNTVGVWSSPTLASGTWTLRSSFAPSASGWPKCLYYRAHAAMRRAANGTATYVLYLNGQGGKDTACDACPDGSRGKCIFAGVSASPAGPFEYRGVVPLRYTALGGIGDFDVFVEQSTFDRWQTGCVLGAGESPFYTVNCSRPEYESCTRYMLTQASPRGGRGAPRRTCVALAHGSAPMREL